MAKDPNERPEAKDILNNKLFEMLKC